MRNNKIAFVVWLFFNYLNVAFFVSALRSIEATGYKTFIVSLNGNLYLYVIATYAFIYVSSLLWDAFQSHIELANVSNEETDKNILLQLIDELSNYILSQSFVCLFLTPIYYWMIRILLLLIGWLMHGEWQEYTTCNAIQSLCNIDSELIGLNKIIYWLGNNDFGFFLLVVCIPLGLLSLKHPKAR